MDKIVAELNEKLVVPVETAGVALNMRPRAIRDAINRKEIPTTGVGKSPMVPTIFIRQRVGIEPA